ncbi:hypothetical protein NIES4074_00430 [Cylindrospermum sp. NIES-4074]|nr:hypothetical protein NIES4074_00430 [Cylindrospermum sp. NIES-4074]
MPVTQESGFHGNKSIAHPTKIGFTFVNDVLVFAKSKLAAFASPET